MLSVLPETNLVSNIGFGPDATHTRGGSSLAELATRPMKWPLVEPTIFAAFKKADDRTADQQFSRGRLAQIKDRVKGLMRSGGGH